MNALIAIRDEIREVESGSAAKCVINHNLFALSRTFFNSIIGKYTMPHACLSIASLISTAQSHTVSRVRPLASSLSLKQLRMLQG